jgi:hypothetical protein
MAGVKKMPQKKQIKASFQFNRDGKSFRVMQRVESGYGQPDNP